VSQKHPCATVFAYAFPLGVWSHIAGVYDSGAGKIRLYLNGAMVAEQIASGSATDTNADFDIGAMGDASTPYDGSVDDACIFNKALTADEVFSLFQDKKDEHAYFM
jgi:Concanavalin A-like lectin/glucanases superfamily